MNAKERIEEAHGLWELAVVRLAALAEAGAPKPSLLKAVKEEREAFAAWAAVSAAACATNAEDPF